MAYKISKAAIAPRKEGMLDRVSGSYDSLAPGLYPDETLVEIGGEKVAVSVERDWMDNGAGINFQGYARWVEEDGTTKQAPNGAPVEAQLGHLASPLQLSRYGVDALASDVARLVLGEAPLLQQTVEVEGGDPVTLDVIDVSPEGRLHASIAHQIKAVKATQSFKINL